MLHNNKPFVPPRLNHNLSKPLADAMSTACDRVCRGTKTDPFEVFAMLNNALSAVAKEEAY